MSQAASTASSTRASVPPVLLWESWEHSAPEALLRLQTGLENDDLDLHDQDFIKVSQSFISVYTDSISSAATNVKLHHLTFFPILLPSTLEIMLNASLDLHLGKATGQCTLLSCKGELSWDVPVVESL